MQANFLFILLLVVLMQNGVVVSPLVWWCTLGLTVLRGIIIAAESVKEHKIEF